MPRITRRTAIKSALAAGAAAGASSLGFPAIAAKTPIKIGAVQPFSGGLELYGGQAKLGLDLAAKEINEAGGIMGSPVEIVYEDNKTDPKASVERSNKLIQGDEVIAVSGRMRATRWRPPSNATRHRCCTPPITKAALAGAMSSASTPCPTRSWRSCCRI
jgi:branched-chain amino acid transport system substrate-binding protein/urea transport system substrate-binding protein